MGFTEKNSWWYSGGFCYMDYRNNNIPLRININNRSNSSRSSLSILGWP